MRRARGRSALLTLLLTLTLFGAWLWVDAQRATQGPNEHPVEVQIENLPQTPEEPEPEPEPEPPPPPKAEPHARPVQAPPVDEPPPSDEIAPTPSPGTSNGGGGIAGSGGTGAGTGAGTGGAATPAPKKTPKKPKLDTKTPRERPLAAKPPRPLPSNAKPDYPKDLRDKGITGRVVIKLHVHQDGSVRGAKILRKDNNATTDELKDRANKLFLAAVIAAVKTWKFQPAQLEGQAISVWHTVTIPFQLTSR